MNTNKITLRASRILYIIMILFTSCEPVTEVEYVEIEVETEKIVTETVIEYEDRVETVVEYEDRTVTVIEYVDVEIETEVETIIEVEKEVIVEKEIIVDNIIDTQSIVYVEKEIYIMSDEVEGIPVEAVVVEASEVVKVVVEPIKEYDNYITTDNKVYGIVDSGFEEIAFISGLFKIDGTLYFKINDKFYSQIDSVITEIDELPIVPDSEFVTFTDSVFKIEQSVYKDDSVSRVYNGTKVEAYMQIDSACMRGNDLLYSVSVGVPSREVGVYIWTVNSGGTMSLFENGRIW